MESYNRQSGNFGTCYVVAQAYSLEQRNTGWAQDGLCHASSFPFVVLTLMVTAGGRGPKGNQLHLEKRLFI